MGVLTDKWAQARPRLIEMAAQGLSKTQIAKALGEGFTHGMVSGQIFQLRKAGIIPGGVRAKTESITWTASMRDVLRKQRANRITFKAIGKEIGVSRDAAIAEAKRLKLPMHPRRQASPEVDHLIREMRNDNKSLNEIVAATGLTYHAVRGRARAMAISHRRETLFPGKPRAAGNDFWTDAKRNIIVDMVKRHFRYQEIADRLNTKVESVTYQVRRLKAAGAIPMSLLEERQRRLNDQKLTKAREAQAARRALAPKRVKKELAIAKPKVSKPARDPVVHLVAYPAVVASFTAASGAGVSFQKLRRFDCRWVLDCEDGETRFCGEPATDCSYCAPHAARAFLPRTSKRAA